MKISEKKLNQMPAELQSLFVRLPNPGSDEVVGLFPQTGKDTAHARNKNGTVNKGYVGDFGLKGQPEKISGFSDSGSAARFFYCAKASRSERNAGLDCYLTVKYNNDKSNNGGLSWEDVSTTQ